MAKNTGTLVGAPIRINDSNDLYASAFMSEIKGGRLVVATLLDMFALSSAPLRLEENVTIVRVTSVNTEYRLTNLSLANTINGWTDTKSELVNSVLPSGLRGDIYRIRDDNSNNLSLAKLVEEGAFITTDAEFEAAKGRQVTQAEIFNTWKRVSIGEDPNNPAQGLITGFIPFRPQSTASWVYSAITDVISSTFNSGGLVGFVSKKALENYTHKATLFSTFAGDNDRIGFMIAFSEDANDQQPNQAFLEELSQEDYPWLDVTSPTIPNQHTLVVWRDRNGPVNSYAVVYNYLNYGSTLLVDNHEPWATTANWAIGVNPTTVDLEVVREGDIITIRTTDFSDAPDGKGELRFPIVIDLNSNPLLTKFKGAKPYGYIARSQRGASFKDISINDGINDIYDLRGTGNIWRPVAGVYGVDTTRTVYDVFMPGTIVYNPTTDTFYYIRGENQTPKYVQWSGGKYNLITGSYRVVEAELGQTTLTIPALQDKKLISFSDSSPMKIMDAMPAQPYGDEVVLDPNTGIVTFASEVSVNTLFTWFCLDLTTTPNIPTDPDGNTLLPVTLPYTL